ncbi:hypothetical protein [Tunturiibacter lichenicola]|uniref:hypothetical protein n=1 Tax=Tunturiibacter lichenicola TaxID=2051959 RepID=UPI003D9B1316
MGHTANDSGRRFLGGHLTVPQLAESWGWSRKTVIRVFENEPGVLVLDRPEARNKRGYRTLTIPIAVAERVHKRLEIK